MLDGERRRQTLHGGESPEERARILLLEHQPDDAVLPRQGLDARALQGCGDGGAVGVLVEAQLQDARGPGPEMWRRARSWCSRT